MDATPTPELPKLCEQLNASTEKLEKLVAQLTARLAPFLVDGGPDVNESDFRCDFIATTPHGKFLQTQKVGVDAAIRRLDELVWRLGV